MMDIKSKFLDEILNCPDVEWKPLWSVTIWDKKFNTVERHKQQKSINYPYLLASELFALEQSTGDVFLLSTGEKTGWTTEELAADYLKEGEVVTLPWGKSRPARDVIKYYKGKFVTADNRIATSLDVDALLNKYLYYWFMSQSDMLDSFYRGSGIQHPNMAAVLDMQIPIPPLPIQQKIVDILDKFTKLTAELTAELTARKQQYEYYRDELLTFGDDVEWKELNEIAEIKRGVRLVRSQLFEDAEYPVYQNSMKPLGYYDQSNVSSNTAFVIGAGAAGEIGYSFTDFWAADDCFYFECSSVLQDRYLYHVLVNQKTYISSQVRRSSIPRLARIVLEKVRVPIPSIDKQAQIVEILDKFDALTNSITEGLPREIELRQQQYEYYRDLLLSFPKPDEVK